MTTTTNHQPTILGIDPGTRFMGFAVLKGKTLLDYGVHTLRNGRRPYDPPRNISVRRGLGSR